MPLILIGIGVAVFFMFTNPLYSEMGELRTKVDSFNEALDNSKALENARDTLTQKQNAIDPVKLEKLEKLLPDNIDNIRLILEIEKIAEPYGMVLKDVKYNSAVASVAPAAAAPGAPASAPAPVQAGGTQQAAANNNKDYGAWDLSFSTTSSYSNFLNFTRDLESNLRIVDISSVQFSSGSGSGSTSTQSTQTTSGTTPAATPAESYKYDFKIKTYWLKN